MAKQEVLFQFSLEFFSLFRIEFTFIVFQVAS